MVRLPSLLVAALLVPAVFAGCLGGDDTPKAPALPSPGECAAEGVCGAAPVVDETTGRDLRTALTADDTLMAPDWQIGDVFEQHIYYGANDQAGEHIVTMVVGEVDGDCYQLGTTSQIAAKTEATFDLPVLGCIGIEHLQTSALGVDWSWMYEFPLQDGKTWDGSVQGLFNWNDNSFQNYEFTLTASYSPAINTPHGDFPGFWISGNLQDGQQLLYYNYVPAVGWFSHFWMYDLSSEAADDIMFHAMSMGTSKGFTGTYYLDESDEVIESFMFAAPLVFGESDPLVGTFTVPDGATYLKGVIAPIACPGQSEVRIVDPGNAVTEYSHTYEGDPQACSEASEDGNPDPAAYTVHWYDEASTSGEWKVAVVGAGLFGAYVWLQAITEKSYELTAPAPEPAADA